MARWKTPVRADIQALQYRLIEAQWDSQAVMDQVAQADNQLLGGDKSCLLLDESGVEKKGEHFVGVARQWNGRLGKVDNCLVGVFAALGRGARATLIDYRLYLPENCSEDEPRCQKMGIPEAFRPFKTKSELALAMVRYQRQQVIRFAWVGADGGYGKEPAFLCGLEDGDEIFVVDVHKDQLIHVEHPQPIISHGAAEKPNGIRRKLNLFVLITGKKPCLKPHGNAINCATVPKVS